MLSPFASFSPNIPKSSPIFHPPSVRYALKRYKLVSKRYEKGSIIITSNKPFEQWGEIFADEVVAAAILDRLLHHSYPFIINGKSYRMKNIAKTN